MCTYMFIHFYECFSHDVCFYIFNCCILSNVLVRNDIIKMFNQSINLSDVDILVTCILRYSAARLLAMPNKMFIDFKNELADAQYTILIQINAWTNTLWPMFWFCGHTFLFGSNAPLDTDLCKNSMIYRYIWVSVINSIKTFPIYALAVKEYDFVKIKANTQNTCEWLVIR